MTPDLPIPEEAASAAANAIKGTWTLFETCPELAREVTDAVLLAALPHLRSLQVETQVRIGRELGRREAQDECAVMLEERASDFMLRSPTASTLLGMARTIRSMGSQAAEAGSDGLTAATGTPSHPKDSQAGSERFPEDQP